MYCESAKVRASRNVVVLCSPTRRLSSARPRVDSPTANASITPSARVTAVTPPVLGSAGAVVVALRILHLGSLCETILYEAQPRATLRSGVHEAPMRSHDDAIFPPR